MRTEISDSTTSGQGSFPVANDSREEFFQNLRCDWIGEDFEAFLDEMWQIYIVTDEYCFVGEKRRRKEVYQFYRIKQVLKDLETEVHHG